MPQYIVERTVNMETGLGLPGPSDPVIQHLAFQEENTRAGANWILSYVTPDQKKAFCLYEAPDPASVRRAAGLNGMPIDRISEVSVHSPLALESPDVVQTVTDRATPAISPNPSQASNEAAADYGRQIEQTAGQESQTRAQSTHGGLEPHNESADFSRRDSHGCAAD